MAHRQVLAPRGLKGISIPDRKAVGIYLRRHSDLAACLPALCNAACKEFGSEAELSLEIYRDPEVRDRYLTLYIRLESYDNDTMARIDRVGGSLKTRLERSTGYLLITTDFRPPRGANGI